MKQRTNRAFAYILLLVLAGGAHLAIALAPDQPQSVEARTDGR